MTTTTGTEKAQPKPAAAARRRQPSRASRGAAAAAQPKTPPKAPAKGAAAKPTPKPKTPAKPEVKGPTTTAKRTAVMNAMITVSADLIDPAKWNATIKRFPALAKLNVTRDEAAEFLAARLSYAPADQWDDRLPAAKELKGRRLGKSA